MSHRPSRPARSSAWSMRGGVAPERIEEAFGDDFDEVLPARELRRRDLVGQEPVIELRFGTSG